MRINKFSVTGLVYLPIFIHGILKGFETRNQTAASMKKKGKKPSDRRANKLAPSRKYVNKILDWCLKTYGKSRYNKDFPEIQYRKASYMNEDPYTMAFYDDEDGVIFINKEDHPNLKVLANSIIHEYTHYKQNSRHYHVLSMYLPYHKNPLEIEANRIANRDTKKCLKEIFEG